MTEAEDRFLGSGRRPASFSLVTARAVHNATDDFHDHRPRSTRRRALFASPNTKDKQHHRYRRAFIPRFSLSLSLPIPPISSFVRPARDGPWWAGSSRTLLQPLSSPTSFYLQPLQINEIAATGTTRFSILLFDSIVEKNRSSASASFDSNFGRVFLAPRKGFRDSWIFNAGPNAGHPFLLPRSSNERSPCLAFLPSAFDAFAPHARIYLDRGSISDLHRPPFPIIVVAIRSVSPRFFSFLPPRNRGWRRRRGW